MRASAFWFNPSTKLSPVVSVSSANRKSALQAITRAVGGDCGSAAIPARTARGLMVAGSTWGGPILGGRPGLRRPRLVVVIGDCLLVGFWGFHGRAQRSANVGGCGHIQVGFHTFHPRPHVVDIASVLACIAEPAFRLVLAADGGATASPVPVALAGELYRKR